MGRMPKDMRGLMQQAAEMQNKMQQAQLERQQTQQNLFHPAARHYFSDL